MVVYITGANGYLGKALAAYFAAKNDHVIALCRKNVFNHPNIQFSFFELGGKLSTDLPVADVCIHCAYDLSLINGKEIYKKNVLGSKLLFDELAKNNCKLVIHISSISAFEDCKSVYGQTKLFIEKIVDTYNGISIRPGLIYGDTNSGLIGKLESIAKLPVIPMIGNGNYTQYLTPINKLCEIIFEITRHRYPVTNGTITLCSTESITLKELIKSFKPKSGWRFIPVFWQLPYYSLKFFESLNLKLPFKSDSIKSLVFSNKSPDFSFMNDNKIIFRKYEKPD